MCLKLRAIFIVGFVLTSWPSFSQHQSTIDSLKRVLVSEVGEKKTSTLIKLALEYSGSDPVLALTYLEDAYGLAVQLGDSASLVKAGWIQGELWKRQDLLDKAVERLTYILPIAKRNKLRKDHKRILNTLAIISTYKANYDVALEYNFQSLNLREEDGDEAGMSISYNNIGLNYFKLSNYELAIEFYNKALNLKRKINDQYDLDRLLINIGLCYNNLGEFKTAREFFYEGLSLCKSECDPSIAIEAEHGLGLSFYGLKKLEEANKHFENALNGALKTNDKRNQIESLISLSKVSFELKNSQKSKDYLERALLAVKNTSYKNPLIAIYQQYSTLADNEKDFEKASHYRKLYIQLRDSIYSEGLIKNLATIQTNFVEKENLAIIQANKIMIKQQREISFSIGFIVVLLSIIAFLVNHQRTEIRRVNGRLSDRVEQKTKEIRDSYRKLKKTMDDRDYFMYKTSHDIKGPLTTLIGLGSLAKRDIHEPATLSYFAMIETTAGRLNSLLARIMLIETLTRTALEYNFIEFKPILEDAINLAKRNLPSEPISITYEIEPNLIVKSDKTVISCILENLISNAVKFYDKKKDSFVKIELFSVKNELILKVIDNGIGIKPATVPLLFLPFSRTSEGSQIGGLGLYLCKLAAEKLDGKIEFESTENYTQFQATLPKDIGSLLRRLRELESNLETEEVKAAKNETPNLSLVFS